MKPGPLPQTPRHVAVAATLQLYAFVDPDSSLELAERVLFAADRAAWRGHAEHGPTHAEVNRAESVLVRRGIEIPRDAVYAALAAALMPGLVHEEEPAA